MEIFKNKCFFFRFYILCENFSKIGPILKKILKFSDDPIKQNNYCSLLRMVSSEEFEDHRHYFAQGLESSKELGYVEVSDRIIIKGLIFFVNPNSNF